MSTQVTLERYAHVRAEMDAGGLRDEVLARAGVTDEEWIDTQRAWLDKMGAELERGRFELTNRYTQAFLERQRALSAAGTSPPTAAAAPPPLAKTLPASPIAAPLPPPIAPAPPPPTLSPPIAPPPIMVMPSEAPLPAATDTADDAVQTRSTPFAAVMHDVLPFNKGPSTLEEPSPREAPRDFDLGSTALREGWQSGEKPALPFTPTPPAVRPRLGSQPDALAFDQDPALPDPADEPSLVAIPEDFDVASTLPLESRRLAEKPALPFTPTPPAVRPTLRSDPDALDQDDEVPSTAQSPLVKTDPVLPFVTPTKALRDASHLPPDRAAHPPDQGSLSSLQGAASPSRPPPAHPSGELPSDQPTEEMRHVQGITLSQYAQICAAVRASPDQVVQIRSYYGMDTHAWVALHTLWQERFQRDPVLKARWQALVEAGLVRRAR